MKEKLNKALAWARSFPLDRTVHTLAVLAWIQDVLSCFYLVKWVEAKSMSETIFLMALKINQISPEEASAELQSEIGSMVGILFSGILLGLIVTNTIFYLGYARKKKWAVPYMTASVVTAGLFGITFWFEGFPVGGLWELVNIVGAPVYLIIGFFAYARKAELTHPSTIVLR